MLLCSCREDSHRTSLIAGNMAYNKLFSCTCSIYIYIYLAYILLLTAKSAFKIRYRKSCMHVTPPHLSGLFIRSVVHDFLRGIRIKGGFCTGRVLIKGFFFFSRNLFSLLLRWFTQVLHGWSVWEGVITSFIFDKTQQFHCNKWNDSFEFITKRT